MARFCKFCGKEIIGETICDCKESLENAARLVNKVDATKEISNKLNYQSKEIFELFKGYFNDIKGTTQKIIKEDNKKFVGVAAILFIIGIICNYIFIFNRISNNINKLINQSSLNWGWSFTQVQEYKLKSNNMSIILYGLLFGLIALSMLILIVFLTSKIINKNLNNKEIVIVTVINTIPMSCFLIIGALLGLVVSYKLIVLIQLIYLLAYIITLITSLNMLTKGFNRGIEVLSSIAISFIGMAIVFSLYSTTVYKTIGSYEIKGISISVYTNKMIDEFKSQFNDFEEDFDVFDMFEEFMY